MSTTINTLHVLAAGSGEWAVKINETAGSSSVHATQALAVAKAWELVRDLVEAEVVVHHEDGRVHSNLTIRQVEADDSDDPAARAEALRLAPSNARLLAGIARRLAGQGPQIEGNFDDDEEMPY